MIDALFQALGELFAGGVGVLLLAVVAGAIFLLWEWRLALAGVVLIHLGLASVLVSIHNVPAAVAAGQMVAVFLCAAMLALVGWLQPSAVSPQVAGNWLLRGLALSFIVAAWWFLDPGYTLPYFSLSETDLLIWSALCALALWSFSASPLFGGIGILLWSAPLYALAAVLLPGSGLAAIIGIVDLFVILACAYLVLLEPILQGSAGRSLPHFLPRLRQPDVVRPWGLVRRAPPLAAHGPVDQIGQQQAAQVLAEPLASPAPPAASPPPALLANPAAGNAPSESPQETPTL